MSDLTVRVFNRAMTSELATLTEETKRSFLAEHNDAGSGDIELLNDDVALPGVDYNAILRFDLDSTPQFATLVEGRNGIAVDADEEAGERTAISGRGTLAIFEDAIVEPELGIDRTPIVEQRAFDYGSKDVDRSAWAAPASSGPVGFVPASGEPDIPVDWKDPGAERIWAPGVDPLTPPVDVGTTYFHKSFTLADAATVRVEATADDVVDVKIDGRPVLSEAKPFLWKETKHNDVFLDAGTHYIDARVTNPARPLSPSTNVAYFLFGLWTVTDGGAAVDTLLVRSDTSWTAIGYPAIPPGLTVGRIIRLLVEEAQARGALPGVTLNFTDTLDSDGVDWPVTADIVVEVGHDLLTVLRQLAETYCDLAMNPASLELNAWVTRGEPKDVDFTVGTNLLRLVHEAAG